ncbi:MAG TPA: hypothetical protein VK083_08500 [Nocardia sp.]|uniref:hypothetical protein n=1 Tax=Nocardia TaxID=1817 RepID=UPI0024551539|nr:MULTISPECIES: hypothetical protein [Nocardia]HLS76811.1 hypothetical protein [Nocardia sp.]
MRRRPRAGSRPARRAPYLLVAASIALATAGCAQDSPELESAGLAPTPTATESSRLDTVRQLMTPYGEVSEFRADPLSAAVVLAHPGQAAVARRLAAELPAALTAVVDFWNPADTAWTDRAVVAVAADRTEFAALLRGATATEVPGGPDAGPPLSAEVAAAAYSDPFRPGTAPANQRVVFAPDVGARLGEDQLRAVLRHELTHLATRTHTGADAPLWLTEGFADYAAHRGLGAAFTEVAPTVRAAVHAGHPPPALPADADFTGPAAAMAYELAWTGCAFVAESYGEPHLIRLYRALAAASADDEERLLGEVLGVARADFLDRWRSWLTERAR